jgi:hypothetical protein
LFAERNQRNLPIFAVTNKTLTDFTTTEKDKKRGVSRFPPKQFRIKDEDIIKEEESKKSQQHVSSSPSTIMGTEVETEQIVMVLDDYQGNLELRGKQYEESKMPQNYEDEEEDGDD